MNEKFTQFKNKLYEVNLTDKSFKIICYLISCSSNSETFPSMRTIAKKLNKSLETIRSGLNELEEKNVISRKNRVTGTGKTTSNFYKINKKYLVTENFKQRRESVSEEIFDYDWLKGERE